MELGVDRSALEQAAEAACRAGLRAGLPEPDARELGQEALLRALSSARPPAGVPLAAWVYGIARNLGRDRAKSARSREVLVDATPEAAADDDLVTVLAVRRALDRLPPPLRDVVTLYELEDHTLRETAAALAIPFDTAKDRLRRAHARLREELAEDVEAACGRERSHSRRRAAASGAAIVAAVWAALGEHAASAASAATAAGSVGASASGRLVVRTWVAAVAGTALIAGGVAVGRLTAPTSVPAPAPRVAAAAPAAPALAAPPLPPVVAAPAVAAPVPGPAIVAARARGSASPSPAPAEPAAAAGSGHAAERLLLDRARAALQRGLTDEALVALMSHARQFPHGELAEERDVMLIEAYLRAGNAALARERIARYRADYPTGALRARVDELARQLGPDR